MSNNVKEVFCICEYYWDWRGNMYGDGEKKENSVIELRISNLEEIIV